MIKKLSLLMAWAILFVGTGGVALGASLVTDLGNGANRNDFTGTVGYLFTTGSSPVVVEQLGFYDEGGDGLGSSHRVGLWTDDGDGGSGTLLGFVTVASGAASVLEDGFRYETLGMAINLAADTSYRIAAEVFDGGDIWINDSPETGYDAPTLNPDFAIQPLTGAGAMRAKFSTSAFDYPDQQGIFGPDNRAFVSANFTSSIPEPSRAMLAMLGFLGVLVRRRR